MSFASDRPFNGLPLIPPAIEKMQTAKIFKACIAARAELAGLNMAGKLLPDQHILLSIIPMLEAKGSSGIENIVTTNDRLFRFAEYDKHADPATKEALRYRTAMYKGLSELKTYPICMSVASLICTTLRGVSSDVRKMSGTHLKDSAENIIYTPPVGEAVIRDLLTNWETYINADVEVDELVTMAIAHYQFESIHPFEDGNGRTGRILNILCLIDRGLLEQPILYLSRYILQHRDDYYTLLRGVTERGEWEPWILFIVKAVEETARWTTKKIEAIRKQIQETRDYVKEQLPKEYTWELVDLLFRQPYCRINTLVDAGILQRQAASTRLKQLTEIGVLEEADSEGNNKVWVNTRLLRELDD